MAALEKNRQRLVMAVCCRARMIKQTWPLAEYQTVVPLRLNFRFQSKAVREILFWFQIATEMLWQIYNSLIQVAQ